jgi:uncharacterized Tic20 family protein
VLSFFVINLRIESFVVVVVVFSLAFVVSIVSSFVELIAISLELLAMLARRVIFFLADNTHLDDDDDDVLNF